MKNKKLLFITLVSTLLLSSCGRETTFSIYEFNKTYIETKVEIETDTYYKNSEYDTLSWRDRNNKENIISSHKDVFSSKSSANPQSFISASSLGDITALIIPVRFLDTNENNNNQKIVDIQNAFLGDKDKTEFHSVREFYYQSSYGELKFDGYVAPFYTFPKTISEMNQASKSVSTSRKVANYALDNFYKTNPSLDMSIFDKDNDKFIDCLYIIYDHPYQIPTNSDELFWAYVDHTYRGEGREGDIRNDHDICIGTYAWISYDFIKSSQNKKVETHTLIHESGHIFGLDDYYNTSSNAIYQPTGFMDMMDCNLGDHTGLSKMLLNWTTPYVLKNSGEIKLRPFSETGDLLLLPSSKGYNNTPYDEYLLLEMYSPKENNKIDAGKKYKYVSSNGSEGSFKFFSDIGLKVYHVDARLALFEIKNSSYPFVLLDDPNLNNKIDEFIKNKDTYYCVDFAFDNSPINNEGNVLYHLLERSGKNTFKEGKPGSNATLFKKGDSFGINTFTDFRFNNGGELNYTFTITSLDSSGITISFNKK